MSLRTFLKGFSTGMMLQFAIGPIFIYIINSAIQHGTSAGIAATLGATAADYIFIILAGFGVAKLLEKEQIRYPFSILSSIVLFLFGVMMIINGIRYHEIVPSENISSSQLGFCFTSTFFLTLSSPLSIVFWTGIFTAKTIEYNLSRRELFVFGFAAGFATFVFIGLCVLVLGQMQAYIPEMVIRLLNIAAGTAIAGYGGLRLYRIKSR